MSDGELVRRILAGRTEAYEELVRRWAGRITAVCDAKVGRAAQADDLAQETLLRGLRSLSTLVDPEKFGPWLCGIAARACLDWLKARERSTVPFSTLGPDFHAEDILEANSRIDGSAWDLDDCRELTTAVETLPEPYRQVLMLYYYQDVTYAEIGELLGLSKATINARLTKARWLLAPRAVVEHLGADSVAPWQSGNGAIGTGRTVWNQRIPGSALRSRRSGNQPRPFSEPAADSGQIAVSGRVSICREQIRLHRLEAAVGSGPSVVLASAMLSAFCERPDRQRAKAISQRRGCRLCTRRKQDSQDELSRSPPPLGLRDGFAHGSRRDSEDFPGIFIKRFLTFAWPPIKLRKSCKLLGHPRVRFPNLVMQRRITSAS